MKIGIISTFPKQGSRNIGDHLITQSTEAAVNAVLPEATFTRFFRADAWSGIAEEIQKQDHLVFACLAIRHRDMQKSVYPYLRQILDTGIPITAIAAGTNLPVSHYFLPPPVMRGGPNAALLREISDRANGFSTRGIITQAFCEDMGVMTDFCGDVAFFDTRFDNRIFVPDREIRRIVISDPHYWREFYFDFAHLYRSLTAQFPSAKIVVALHGRTGFENVLKQMGVETKKIYEDPVNGLDIYDTVDLHVGFRVHAHVSALKRRVYSYLVEQDGRGADYGATIARNISVPAFASPLRSLRSLGRRRRPNEDLVNGPSRQPIFRLMAVVRADSKTGFRKFSGLETQLNSFNAANLEFLTRTITVGQRRKRD